MKKKIEFIIKITREFETIALPVLIKDKLVLACKETVIKNDETYINEFLCFQEDFDKVEKNNSIPSIDYKLYNKNIENLVNINTYSSIDLKELENLIIKNPYSYLKENIYGKESKLYKYDYNHHLYDINDNEYPYAIFFDYTSLVTDKYYDLLECINLLKDNEQIKLKKGSIEVIPYYNRHDNGLTHLSFWWFPTQEEFNKINKYRSEFERKQYILNEILKLPKVEE